MEMAQGPSSRKLFKVCRRRLRLVLLRRRSCKATRLSSLLRRRRCGPASTRQTTSPRRQMTAVPVSVANFRVARQSRADFTPAHRVALVASPGQRTCRLHPVRSQGSRSTRRLPELTQQPWLC